MRRICVDPRRTPVAGPRRDSAQADDRDVDGAGPCLRRLPLPEDRALVGPADEARLAQSVVVSGEEGDPPGASAQNRNWLLSRAESPRRCVGIADDADGADAIRVRSRGRGLRRGPSRSAAREPGPRCREWGPRGPPPRRRSRRPSRRVQSREQPRMPFVAPLDNFRKVQIRGRSKGVPARWPWPTTATAGSQRSAWLAPRPRTRRGPRPPPPPRRRRGPRPCTRARASRPWRAAGPRRRAS